MSPREYAWAWFSLHSNQRMQLVNFWLVAVAFLAAAFVQALMAKLLPIAVGVCVAGVLASMAFAMLDARTRQLVQIAEAALMALDSERLAEGGVENGLVEMSGQGRTRGLSYRLIIEGLQIGVAVLFLAGGVYALAS